ncbi:MAG: hypothetical protein ABJA16_04680 [Nakamurella sp.]
MSRMSRGAADRDDDAAAVVAVITALAGAIEPARPAAEPGGWGVPALRAPVLAAGPQTWWRSGLPG